MKLALIFGLLCIVCLGIYATAIAIGGLGIAVLAMLSGWGAGAFFILAIVMFVLKR